MTLQHGEKAAKQFAKLIRESEPHDGQPGKNRSMAMGRAGDVPVILVSKTKPSAATRELQTMSKSLGTFSPLLTSQVEYVDNVVRVKSFKPATLATVKKVFLDYFTHFKASAPSHQVELWQPEDWDAKDFEEDPDEGEAEGEGADGEEEEADDSDGEAPADPRAEACAKTIETAGAHLKLVAGKVGANAAARPLIGAAAAKLTAARGLLAAGNIDGAEEALQQAQEATLGAAKAAAAHGDGAAAAQPAENGRDPEAERKAGALSERLKSGLAAVRALKDGMEPAAYERLAGSVREIAAQLQGGHADAAELLLSRLEAEAAAARAAGTATKTAAEGAAATEPAGTTGEGAHVNLFSLGKARIEWRDTLAAAQAEMGELKAAIGARFQGIEAATANVDAAMMRLDQAIGALTSELSEALDEVLNAEEAKRAGPIARSRQIIDAFSAHLADDPVMAALDGNEVRPETAITGPLKAKLSEISAALG